jgi:hypothetical protein
MANSSAIRDKTGYTRNRMDLHVVAVLLSVRPPMSTNLQLSDINRILLMDPRCVSDTKID